MAKLSGVEASHKRNQLVVQGFSIVPNVMPKSLLNQLCVWSDNILDHVTVDHKIRYQGSDIFVYTERLWVEVDRDTRPNHFPAPLAENIIEIPDQKDACRLIGLESLKPDDVVIILSKLGYGPPLYWHQDFMKWNSPEAATPWPTRIFLILLSDRYLSRERMPACYSGSTSQTPPTARYSARCP